jgi:APA family basic amino acid/polyamine antiporter
LRFTNPERKRPFRTPVVWLVGPLALVGCAVLFALLPSAAKLVFFGWAAFGLVIYGVYGYRRSAFAIPADKPPKLNPKLS